MTLSPIRVLHAARALWARDRAILLPLCGLFLFVPQWAILLLVPQAPAIPHDASGEVAMAQWSQVFSAWLAANAPAYGGAALAGQFGSLALAALYVGRGAGQAGTALRRAGALFGRYLLALALLWMPPMLAAGALVAGGGAGLAMVLAPVLYLALLVVTVLLGPAVAAGGGGAPAAVGRGWAVTRGHRAALFALVAGVSVTAQIAAALLLALGEALRTGSGDNPVVLAIVTAGAAAVLATGATALALSGVIAFRALAR